MNIKGIVTSILIIGTLTSCASQRQLIRTEADLVKLAKAELKQVDEAMRMYREASDDNAFPEENLIQSYGDLWQVLLPYEKLPWDTNTHWTFMSYQRPSPGVYMIQALVVRVLNRRLSVSNDGEIVEVPRRVPPAG
ncbi:hypothetical protein ACFL44_00035 [Gemmatimonadota bacterium]